jgi:hypothetical protein
MVLIGDGIGRRDMERAYQTGNDGLRELSTAEIEEVSGGFVDVMIWLVASNVAAGKAYYGWLKENGKI